MTRTAKNNPEATRPGDLPKRADSALHPVKPKDSASMLVLRVGAHGIDVLMGRRGREAAFGNAYVFAGGKVDRTDWLPCPSWDLDPDLACRLSRDPNKARALAMTAVRETFEETGLVLGAPGDLGETGDESWEAMRALGVAPNLARLVYLGRAITPASRAIRFHARFFFAWSSDMTGELGGSGELADLAFIPVRDALDLPLVDVTQFMLEELLRREEVGFAVPDNYPFFGYRKERRHVRYI